jgi:tetratricopeptide (TPR) repeat protein
MVQLEERDHWGSFIFTRFFEWYAPYFAAYSFVLARAQEYEADRLASETLGSENVADMLVSLEISGARLQEEFWPSIYKVADVEAEPPPDVYLEMQRTFHSEVASDLGQRWLQRALLGETDCLDTHPSLSDRLRALRQEPRLPGSLEQSAAEHFRAGIADDELNRNWKSAIRGSWKERHKYAQESKQRLSELEEKAERDPLTVEEAWQRASWTEEFRDAEAALPLYHQVLSLKSDHPEARFSIGRLLLQNDQPEGIDEIEKAIRLNVEYTLAGCQLVCSFLVEKGRKQDAQAFYERAISRAPRLGDIGGG